MTEENELVCVHTCQGWDVAQIYRSKLEAMGIPVLLKYESASLVFGITVDGLGEVRIMVPQTYASEAAIILEVSDATPEENFDDAFEQENDT
jgi:hypothetical protein